MSMTVSQLIKCLEEFDGDMEVRMAQPTHNYWREIAAVEVDSIDEGVVGYDEMVYDRHVDAIKNSDGYNLYILIRS